MITSNKSFITTYLNNKRDCFEMFRLILIITLVFTSQILQAGQQTDFTEKEIRCLPRVIEIKLRTYLGDKSPQYKKMVNKYKRIYGSSGFGGLHHYGMGLICLQRYLKESIDDDYKRFMLDRAINEFSFTLDPNKLSKYQKNFIHTFLPPIYLKRGMAYSFKQEYVNAVKDFQSLIKIKPSYFPAYKMLSQCYRQLGMHKKAQRIIEIGIKRSNRSN